MEISILISSLTWIPLKKLTASIHHVGRFLKLGLPIYNSEVPDTAGRKTIRRKRRRTLAIAKRYAFHADAITQRENIIHS